MGRNMSEGGGLMSGAAEDDGLQRKRAEAFGRRREMRECTYYNRVFGGQAEVMRITVDSIGKCSHFIETVTTVTATGAANLYLRIFVRERQDDWYTLLPLAEFSYNNHIHSSTQQTPFLLDTSQHPRMGFEPHQPPSRFEAVNEFTDRMKDTLEEAKLALAKAKDDMARYYNRRRSPTPSFSPSDMVYLDSEDIQTTRRESSRTAA